MRKETVRDGHIDVARTTIGTSFWFTPALDKDIRLLMPITDLNR